MDCPRYQLVLTPDETGGWFATVPQCPGALSQGDTLLKAAANITEALNLWLEGAAQPAPLPFPVDDSSGSIAAAAQAAYDNGYGVADNPYSPCYKDPGGTVAELELAWRSAWGHAYANDQSH